MTNYLAWILYAVLLMVAHHFAPTSMRGFALLGSLICLATGSILKEMKGQRRD